MSLGRSRDAYSQYGNKCNLAGVFCGQTLGWRETTGYVFGVTTVTIMVRGMSGIFAKAAEVGSELIFKLEPDQAADPRATRPRSRTRREQSPSTLPPCSWT